MIDLSIKSIKNLSEYELNLFKKYEWIGEEKYDGIKVSLLRNSEPYNSDFTKNWIVSYKGNVIYPNEFRILRNYQSLYDNQKPIGCSQFQIIFDHLHYIHMFDFNTKNIPNNTEFFIEFIMRKPTLTIQYKFYYKMFLIGYKTVLDYSIENSKMDFFYEEDSKLDLFFREEYSRMLQIEIPMKLIEINKNFQDLDKIDLKDFESQIGGKIEGIVFRNKNNDYYKLVQEDQYDKDVRRKIKDKWRMEETKEFEYWKTVHEISNEIIKEYIGQDLEYSLGEISKKVYLKDFNSIIHEKKNNFQKTDDIYLTCKMTLIRTLNGNNWCLFPGKFRVFTKGHLFLLEESLKKYDGVVIALITGKDSEISEDTKYSFLIHAIYNLIIKNIIIQKFKNSNFSNILLKTNKNINTIVCGSDRDRTYYDQIKLNFNIKIDSYVRDDISATKVINFIKENNFEEYKLLVPESLGNREIFEEYREIFK